MTTWLILAMNILSCLIWERDLKVNCLDHCTGHTPHHCRNILFPYVYFPFLFCVLLFAMLHQLFDTCFVTYGFPSLLPSLLQVIPLIWSPHFLSVFLTPFSYCQIFSLVLKTWFWCPGSIITPDFPGSLQADNCMKKKTFYFFLFVFTAFFEVLRKKMG